MAFLTQCMAKDCRKYQNPVLDLKKDIIVCSDCGAEIKNLSSIVKKQLKDMGQVKKSRSGQSYSVKCTNCSHDGTPKVNGKKLLCVGCNTELKVSDQWKKLFLSNIKKETE